MNKKLHRNYISGMMLTLIIVFSLCAGLSLFIGNKFCVLQGEYVKLEYSYMGHSLETGSSCSVYYNGRWISASTYYEYNDIHIRK